jgi:hypothetical protein
VLKARFLSSGFLFGSIFSFMGCILISDLASDDLIKGVYKVFGASSVANLVFLQSTSGLSRLFLLRARLFNQQ